MSTSNLIRWSGLAAVIGGVLFAASGIVDFFLVDDEEALSVIAQTNAFLVMTLIFWAAFLLILLSMVGLYAYQAERAGVFGLVAFLVTFVGLALTLGAIWTFAFVPPSLVDVAPEFLDAEDPPGILGLGFIISFTLPVLGLLLMGLSTLWANALPRWMAALFIAGILLDFGLDFLPVELPMVGDVLFGIGVAALGYGLWAEKSAIPAPAQPMPATA